MTDHLTQAVACFDSLAATTAAVIAERDRLRAENARLRGIIQIALAGLARYRNVDLATRDLRAAFRETDNG